MAYEEGVGEGEEVFVGEVVGGEAEFDLLVVGDHGWVGGWGRGEAGRWLRWDGGWGGCFNVSGRRVCGRCGGGGGKK